MGHNVADQLISILTDAGVKRIYGIPGDTIDPIIEALRVQDKIQFIIMRHEEAGAFAASGQAKLTGELAVCMACQGPGAVHLLNGLYDAKLDRIPVLALTGQVDSSKIGTHYVQDINTAVLFSDVAEYSVEARNAQTVPEMLTQAIQIARTHSTVTHVSLPMDVQLQKAIKWPAHNVVLNEHGRQQAVAEDLKIAADLINSADKVSILYGGGTRGAVNELITLSQKLKAPLVHTTRSKDIIDNMHPHYVGGIGLMGTIAGNHAIQDCDLLLILGSSFSFSEYYPESAQIVQIDRDATRLGLHHGITHGVTACTKLALEELLPLLKEKNDTKFLQKMQSKHQEDLKHQAKIVAKYTDGQPVHPQALTEKIATLADDDAVFVVGTGTVTMWANSYLHLNGKQRFLWSWNLATLGWALGAAIGCQLEAPTRQVIVPIGDGGFEMLIGDFATCMKYNLPIVFIVYNNASYGMIRFEQQAEGNPIYGTSFTNPDFAKLATAYGALGLTINTHADIEPVLKQAYAAKRPTIINAFVNPNELYIPPKINSKQAIAFAKSTIKSFFTQRKDT